MTQVLKKLKDVADHNKLSKVTINDHIIETDGWMIKRDKAKKSSSQESN